MSLYLPSRGGLARHRGRRFFGDGRAGGGRLGSSGSGAVERLEGSGGGRSTVRGTTRAATSARAPLATVIPIVDEPGGVLSQHASERHGRQAVIPKPNLSFLHPHAP